MGIAELALVASRASKRSAAMFMILSAGLNRNIVSRGSAPRAAKRTAVLPGTWHDRLSARTPALTRNDGEPPSSSFCCLAQVRPGPRPSARSGPAERDGSASSCTGKSLSPYSDNGKYARKSMLGEYDDEALYVDLCRCPCRSSAAP